MPTTPERPAARRLVFSDLDGTLLRHHDYRFDEAAAALAELAVRRVPLVIASSKTRAEIELWRARLGNHDPFISENGGALFVPPGTIPEPLPVAMSVAGYQCVEFGTPYARLRELLGEIAAALGVPLRGFGDMTAAEVAELTDLSLEDVALAMLREYDEPFVPARELREDEERRLDALAAALGQRITRGGRFHHLIGPSSKGRAAHALVSSYQAGGVPVVTMGLGDGANDLDLLLAVDHPVVVARPDGTHTPGLVAALPHARFTAGAGPAGFAEAVMEWLGG